MLQKIRIGAWAGSASYSINLVSAYTLPDKLIVISEANQYGGPALQVERYFEAESFVDIPYALPVVHYILNGEVLGFRKDRVGNEIAIDDQTDIADILKQAKPIELKKRNTTKQIKSISLSLELPRSGLALTTYGIYATKMGLITLSKAKPVTYNWDSGKYISKCTTHFLVDATLAKQDHPITHFLVGSQKYNDPSNTFIVIENENELAPILTTATLLYPKHIANYEKIEKMISEYLKTLNAENVVVIAHNFAETGEPVIQVSYSYLNLDMHYSHNVFYYTAEECDDTNTLLARLPIDFSEALKSKKYYEEHPLFLRKNQNEIFRLIRERLKAIDAKPIKLEYNQNECKLFIEYSFLNKDLKKQNEYLSYHEHEFKKNESIQVVLDKFFSDTNHEEQTHSLLKACPLFLRDNKQTIKALLDEGLQKVNCRLSNFSYGAGEMTVRYISLNDGKKGGLIYRETDCKNAGIFFKDISTDLAMIWLDKTQHIYDRIRVRGNYGDDKYTIYFNNFMGHRDVLNSFWDAETMTFNANAFNNFARYVNSAANPTATSSNGGLFTKTFNDLKDEDIKFPFIETINLYKGLLMPYEQAHDCTAASFKH